MKKYSVKKGEDGKYKLVKKAVKAADAKSADAIDNEALAERIKEKKSGQQG